MKKIKNTSKNKSKVNYKTEEQQEMIRFLIIVVIIAACVAGVYFFTKTYVTKDDAKEEAEMTTPASVNYDVTIIGSLLNRPYDEYYAMIYDSTSVSANKYLGVYTSYAQMQNKEKLYYVDLSNVLNAPYYTEGETNPKAKTIEDLKLGDFTLIKIKNKKIVKYLEDFDEIKKELKIED